ncbi:MULTISPECIES: hypothetical protein [Vagococcus]|uniref:Uncharacterized protein n=1 Tax=Vagococcus elongatus TaxID=180344 RepID=A0A430AW43_9ENTE|nr:hypothetical protein [Vagococcus elongatus]RSU12269.1 hypothetical protein CBF29_06625 [Vagococcus elongatus]
MYKYKNTFIDRLVVIILFVMLLLFLLGYNLYQAKKNDTSTIQAPNSVVQVVDVNDEISHSFSFQSDVDELFLMEVTETSLVPIADIKKNGSESTIIDFKFSKASPDKRGNLIVKSKLDDDKILGKNIYVSQEEFKDKDKYVVESLENGLEKYVDTTPISISGGLIDRKYNSLKLVNSSVEYQRNYLSLLRKEEKNKSEKNAAEKLEREKKDEISAREDNKDLTINETYNDENLKKFTIENITEGQTIEISGESDGVVTAYLKTIYDEQISSDISSGGQFSFYFNPSVPKGGSGSFHVELKNVEPISWHIKVY